MGIELVIFDCDGVLVDSESITTAAWVESLRSLGLVWEVEDVLHRFRGGTVAAVVAAAEQELGAPVPRDFVPRFRELLYRRLEEEVRAVPGIEAALDAIDRPTCVASNGPHAKMRVTLTRTGLLPRFEGRIFSAYDVGSFKPDPGLFLHAARTLGARPERCVVVEDSPGGVRAGVAAGMAVLAYDAHGGGWAAPGATRFGDMAHLPDLLAGAEGRLTRRGDGA